MSLFCAMFCSLGIAGNHLVTRISVEGCVVFFGGGGAFGSVGNYLVTRVLEGGCVVFLWCFALLMVRVTIWLPVIWVVAFVCIMGWNYEV